MSVANSQKEVFRNRSRLNTLLVARPGNSNIQIRGALHGMGISSVNAVPSHVSALERMKGKNYQLVIFEAKAIDMPPTAFVEQALRLDPKQILVAIAGDPQIDDIFDLLKCGARGFIVPPFSVERIEQIVMNAADGPPFSEAVLTAPDRNAALVGVVLNNFYRLTVRMRQARKFSSAHKEVERYRCSFNEAMELARLFCEGGNEADLMLRIQEECAARSEVASSRLGRMRQRLAKQRKSEVIEE